MIPKIIHHIWVGPALPHRLSPYIDSWRTLHPEWEHRFHTGFDDLLNQDVYDRAEEITPHVGQLRSDLARYELLHRHGGVYVDCDMEALQSFDGLLGVPCFAGWERQGRWVNNAVLGAVPGHPLLAELIERASESIRRNAGERPNRMTGPHLLTPLARDRDDVVIHDEAVFYPYGWDELDRQGSDYGDAMAVHHWDNARKREGLVDA